MEPYFVFFPQKNLLQLICLSKYNTALAGFAADNTSALFRFSFYGQKADSHTQRRVDFLLTLIASAPVRAGKSAMNFGFVFILWCKEIFEGLQIVQIMRMGLLKRLGLLKEIILDIIQ